MFAKELYEDKEVAKKTISKDNKESGCLKTVLRWFRSFFGKQKTE